MVAQNYHYLFDIYRDPFKNLTPQKLFLESAYLPLKL
jgi:hypothetical protein